MEDQNKIENSLRTYTSHDGEEYVEKFKDGEKYGQGSEKGLLDSGLAIVFLENEYLILEQIL